MIPHAREQRVGRRGPCQTETVPQRRRLRAQSGCQRVHVVVIVQSKARFYDQRNETVNSPGDVAEPIGERESSFSVFERLDPITLKQVPRAHPGVREDHVVHIAEIERHVIGRSFGAIRSRE